MPAPTPVATELDTLREAVLAAGRDAGLDAVGIASAEPFGDVRAVLEERKEAGLHGGMAFTYRNPARSTDPARTVPGARALVVGALSYRRAEPDGPLATSITSPTPPTPPTRAGIVARYSWEDYYAPLRQALGAARATLEDAGWRAVVVADDNALVDRAAARRAGLGWYGKNANLLLHGVGSWFVLGSVITDAPLRPTASTGTAPGERDGCGTCDRCLPACPTGALVAPGVLDARRCLAWLLEAPGVFPAEHRAALGARIYGCDDCQEACPPNKVELRRHPPAPASTHAQTTVDVVVDILEERDDDRLLQRFERWYVAQANARHLRRNALVVLGNVGDAHDVRTRRAVEDALRHDDPLVRAHAVWAARRITARRIAARAPACDTDADIDASSDASTDASTGTDPAPFAAELERLRRDETDELVRAELASD